LKLLVNKYSKNQHLLTETDINGDDGMNYAAVEKFVDVRVTDLLAKEGEDRTGTIIYLKMMRCAVSAFVDVNLILVDRIFNIWYATFLLRGWKEWLLNHPALATENFITSNAYACIEVNAHAILQIVHYCKDQPELCLPFLANSQHCEKFFRYLRSMTSTMCTVVNFSLKDLMSRIRRIDLEQELSSDLKSTFVMPDKNLNIQPSNSVPNEMEINEIVENARLQAVTDLERVGIFSTCYQCQLTGTYEENEQKPTATISDLTDIEECDADDEIISDLSVLLSNCPNSMNLPHIEKLEGNSCSIPKKNI